MKGEPGWLAAAKLVKDWVILYHWTEGWPMMTEPKLKMPLLAGERMPVLVPERVTYAGVVPAPAVTASRPWRAPGCDGAKVKTTLQELPPAKVAVQLVVSVKSPVRTSESAKAEAPVFWMVRVWVLLETPVTATAVAKLSDGGGDAEVGVDAGSVGGWLGERAAGDQSGQALVEQEGLRVGRWYGRGLIGELKLADGERLERGGAAVGDREGRGAGERDGSVGNGGSGVVGEIEIAGQAEAAGVLGAEVDLRRRRARARRPGHRR